MRSPGRRRGRGREPMRRRGDRQADGPRFRRPRPGGKPGIDPHSSNNEPIGRRPSRSPIRRNKLIPPKERNPAQDDERQRPRPKAGGRPRTPVNQVKDLREKLTSRHKNQEKDGGPSGSGRDGDRERKRSSSAKGAKEKNRNPVEDGNEELPPPKKRSPARPPSPPEEPSVTSTVHNSDVELDYDYESMHEEPESPERKPNFTPERSRSPKIKEERVETARERSKSPGRRKIKQEESVERKKPEKKVKREDRSRSRDKEFRRRSTSPPVKKEPRRSSLSPKQKGLYRRSVSPKESSSRLKQQKGPDSSRERYEKPLDRQRRMSRSPGGHRGPPPREVRAPRRSQEDDREQRMLDRRDPIGRDPRGKPLRSRTPSLSPPKRSPLRKVVGLKKKPLGKGMKANGPRNRTPKFQDGRPSDNGRRPSLTRERSPPPGPSRGRSPRRHHFSPPLPPMMNVRVSPPPRRVSPGRRTPPRRVSPVRRFSPLPPRRVSPMRLVSPGRRISPGPPRGRRVSPGPGFGGFREDRPDWRDFRPREVGRPRMLPPPPPIERFREPSPRFDRRPLTPEWGRRLTPERFPDMRFDDQVERYHDPSRLLPPHPNERRLVRTTTRNSRSPSPLAYYGRPLRPAEFEKRRSHSRSPIGRPYIPSPLMRPPSRSRSPQIHRKRSVSLKRSRSGSPEPSKTPVKHRRRSRSVAERSVSRSEKSSKKKSGAVKEKKKSKTKDSKKSDSKKSKEKKASKKGSTKSKPKKVKKKKEESKKKKKKSKREESSSESSSSESSSSSDSESGSSSESTSSDEESKSKKKTKKTSKKDKSTPVKDSKVVEAETAKEPEAVKEPISSPVTGKPAEEYNEESDSEESVEHLEPREVGLPVFMHRTGLEASLGPDIKGVVNEVLTVTKPCSKDDLSSWRDKEPNTPLSERFARCSRINPRPRSDIVDEPIVLKVTMNTESTSRRQNSPSSRPLKSDTVSAPIPAPAAPPNWEDPKVRLAYYTALGFLPKGSTFEDMRAYELQRVGHKPSAASIKATYDRNPDTENDDYSSKTSRADTEVRRKEKRKSESDDYHEKKRKY